MVSKEFMQIIENAALAENMVVDEQYENLTEAQCDEIYAAVLEAVNSDKPLKQSLRESDILGPLVVAGGAAVLTIIAVIRNVIKTKYRMKAKAIANQSKELTDLFTKVEDLLKHDKMARFKHRNDKINLTLKEELLIHNTTGVKYKPTNIYIGYNANGVINVLEERINFVKSKNLPKDQKTATVASISSALTNSLEQNFEKDYWFTRDTTPSIVVKELKNLRLEDVLMYYRGAVNNLYLYNYQSNQYVTALSTNLETVELGYRKMTSKYDKDPDFKKLIDDVFKEIIKEITTVLDFNSGLMNIEEDLFRYYVESMQKLYDYIRS